jgi:tetratricopeptide (TPR) repeat protein
MRLRFTFLAFVSFATLGFAMTPREAAIGLYKSKNYPAARPAFEKLVASDPRDAEAHFYLGMMAERRGDLDEAIAQLEAATSFDPKNSLYFTELGGAYGGAAAKAGLLAKLGWAKKCQDALEKAVALDPANLDARNGLVSFYRAAPTFAGGGIDKAYAEAEEIQRRDPLIGAAVLGQLYISEKKYDEAFELYEKTLRSFPDHYLTLYAIGRTSAQTGLRPQRGEQALRRCLELKPVKGDPGHAAVEWRLGNLAEKRHDPAAARAAYEAALKLNPDFTEASRDLARLKP